MATRDHVLIVVRRGMAVVAVGREVVAALHSQSQVGTRPWPARMQGGLARADARGERDGLGVSARDSMMYLRISNKVTVVEDLVGTRGTGAGARRWC